jgi:uncharacterized protein
MAALLLAAVLVAYNNSLNLWPVFNGRLYVPMNLTFAAVLLLVATRALDLSLEALGLAPGQVPGAIWGIALGGLLATPLFVASSTRRGAGAVADKRMGALTPRQLLFRATIRVPLGTALLEEVAFRGVLYAALLTHGSLKAAVLSSTAFGLWHLAPAHNLMRANNIAEQGRSGAAAPRSLGLLAAALLAFGAGMGLVWIRMLFGGIAAPLALHATVNSLATVSSHLAAKRAGSELESGRRPN